MTRVPRGTSSCCTPGRPLTDGRPVSIRRSIAHRNAERVLPDPVGAAISVLSPRAIGGQPSTCGGVGSPKARSNHSRTGGEKCVRAGGVTTYRKVTPSRLQLVARSEQIDRPRKQRGGERKR